MASSKTVFRPRWVRAEHSRYFTESGVRQQENRGLGEGRVLGKAPRKTHSCPGLWGPLGLCHPAGVYLPVPVCSCPEWGAWIPGECKTHESRSVSLVDTQAF